MWAAAGLILLLLIVIASSPRPPPSASFLLEATTLSFPHPATFLPTLSITQTFTKTSLTHSLPIAPSFYLSYTYFAIRIISLTKTPFRSDSDTNNLARAPWNLDAGPPSASSRRDENLSSQESCLPLIGRPAASRAVKPPSTCDLSQPSRAHLPRHLPQPEQDTRPKCQALWK